MVKQLAFTLYVMDELGKTFAVSFSVGQKPNDTAAPHPRLSQFKQRGDRNNQEERRLRKLESQKKDRQDFVNKARCLAEEDWSNYVTEEQDEDWMDSSTPRVKGRAKRRRPQYYKDQLMLSEWLVDVPKNFAEDWLMVLCPVGKRNLVVAARGKTSCYSKSGYRLSVFPSSVPGGSRKNTQNSSDYSILDCIYYEASRTFYVLDIMCWKGHPVYDSETEFRFYWLQTKMSEVPELAMHKNINPSELDGLLFYHKEAHYAPGSTPLVGWLKPWMLPDMLGVPVPDSVIASKPPGADMRPPDPSMEAAIAGTSSAASEKTKSGAGVEAEMTQAKEERDNG